MQTLSSRVRCRSKLVGWVLGLGLGLVLWDSPPAAAQSGPPLSSVRIIQVRTPRQGDERIPPYAMATARDHGGSPLEFTTEELGYGRPVIATFNGQRASLIRERYILDNRGRLIGYVRGWRVNTNVSSGRIQFASDSTVFPHRRLSTTLFVR